MLTQRGNGGGNEKLTNWHRDRSIRYFADRSFRSMGKLSLSDHMAENKQQLSMFGWDEPTPTLDNEPVKETPAQWTLRAWLRALKESRESGDKRREAFALRVLKDVLEVKDIS